LICCCVAGKGEEEEEDQGDQVQEQRNIEGARSGSRAAVVAEVCHQSEYQ
jgi:hypothetical protein